MKHFKCPSCGSDSLFLTYDATVMHQVTMNEDTEGEPFDFDDGQFDSDYYYFYAHCGECNQEIYEGKYPERLKETIIEEGWYTG